MLSPSPPARASDLDGGWLPSTTKSSTAVTVTVCAVFQFKAVKISDVGLTVLCASGVIVRVTSKVGAVLSLTVYVSVVQPSVTSVEAGAPDSTIKTPATSLSVMLTTTGAIAKPS